jgi:hypothetical protein
MQTTMEKLIIERYIIDLADDIDDVLNESDDDEGLYFACEDDEWGNDF